MRAKGLVLLLLSCSAVSAQPWRESIGNEGEILLKQQRLDRLKGFTLEAPALNLSLKRQLLQSEDQPLIEAALRDQSTTRRDALDGKIRARLQLFNAAIAARSAELEPAFSLGEDKLLQLARTSADPAEEVRRLKFRLDPRGIHLILPKPGVLIVNPEKNAPDSAPPGVLGPGGKPLIHRPGLRFAALIGVPRNNRYELQCSGTVVSKYWLITAAHCMRDGVTGQQLPLQQLAVFLPFQGGSESVAGLQGRMNRNLKRVAVEEMTWIGKDKDAGDDFPMSDEDWTKIVNDGRDLALLRLRKSDMDALPASIETVRLHRGAPSSAPVSMIGYGITNAKDTSDLTLMVGVREFLPDGTAEQHDLLIFGPPAADKAGGICGGDSGGGVFAGRISGEPGPIPLLIGVTSALLANVPPSSADVCVARQQGLASLISERNRKFVCSRISSVCS